MCGAQCLSFVLFIGDIFGHFLLTATMPSRRRKLPVNATTSEAAGPGRRKLRRRPLPKSPQSVFESLHEYRVCARSRWSPRTARCA